jgi:hypothetical protein
MPHRVYIETTMRKRPLYVYVISAAIVWAIILGVMRYKGHIALLHASACGCAGFFFGMLAMYVAVHIYKWK